MKTYKVIIRDKIADIVSSRQAIISLFNNKELNQYDKIILDFSKVEFISRSAADQLVKEREHTKLDVVIINQSSNIKKMIAAVEKTQNGSSRVLEEVPILKFKNKTDLFDFLSTI